MTIADRILQMDPGAGYRAHKQAIDAAVARVLSSGWYILGKEGTAFEAAFAHAFGLGPAVGVASGTDALVLALRALAIGPGDRVATVSHTAVATVAAIELAGADPVLVDVLDDTLTLDPQSLAGAFAAFPTIRAVIPVHLYGHPADLGPIIDLAARHGAFVIEDCAQAHGARLGGRPVGSFGDAAAFSFYPTKNLGALGDGGLVACRSEALAERVRQLRQYGWRQRYVSDEPGLNSRLDEIQAAILSVRLVGFEADRLRRLEIATAYRNGLAGCGLVLPTTRAGAEPAYHQFVIRHPERDALAGHLGEQGIGTNVHYPIPVHLQPAYRERVALAPGGLAVTERAASEVLSLPLYPELSEASVSRVIGALRRAI